MLKTNKQINKSTNLQIAVASLICLFAYSLVGLFSKVSAQSAIPLVVAPARQSLEADPGTSAGFVVRFYNTGIDAISGTFKVADFIVDNKEGSPTFIEGPETLSNRYAAADWVTLSTEKGTIPEGGMVAVNGRIDIPENANPGGKYFAVFFEPTANLSEDGSESKQESSVSVRIAGLVYLKVSGAISENAQVINFGAPKFLEYGPVKVLTEIRNSGDYHITPKGQVVIKNMFGKEVAKVDLPETNIFPGASRTIMTELGKKWMIGKFTANLDAVYGESEKALTASLSFWVFPWKVATIVALAIIIIVLVVLIITNKLSKKQKELVEELTEEKKELDKLKETLKDKISEITPNIGGETPPAEEPKDKTQV